MDLKKVLSRIERRLKAVNLSASAASKRAKKPDAIRNIQRAVKSGDRQGVSTATLTALAPVLHTTLPWLTDGVGLEDPSAEQKTAPVWGQAGAGGQVYGFQEGNQIDYISAPEGVVPGEGLIEITGNSLGPLFDRWYAVVDEVRHPPTTDLIGQLCVVGLADGSVYVKKLKKGRGKKFTLESNFDPPIYDVEVKWATKVKNLVPR